ncbi:MAG: phospho-N-acetylmuramoyl-pentapeptide-transferase [Oscillospiraceae bacterium]|jgi:phospho-N-acetylmuramoyl-pentapeptide-transferase|nr:phospho-N-acetylmuramoyl-pentapeptide-transferase [Oscillospiraceae bacterium]
MDSQSILWVVFSIVAGFVAALLLGKLLIPALRALKAGQSIREVGPQWHKGKAGTPTMGGIAFILASLVCVITGWTAMRQDGQYAHLMVLALAFAFGLIGFADDFIKVKRKRNLGLTGIQKLLLQILFAAAFVWLLYRADALHFALRVPFFENLSIAVHPVLYFALSIFIIVGCVNAVNLTDGVDGLASGVTMPVMLFFVLVSTAAGKLGLATFPAALLGGLGGFLCYNFYPAKVFMGDTGSLFLGGAVCGMAFALDMPLILLLVGIIYIIEALSDILQVGYFKLTHGKRIFRMAPYHHHLELGGWSEKKIWTVFVLTTCIACVLAWLGVRAWF